MRDRLEEPFEFRVHTTNDATSSRRPKDSLRVGALVLALGIATFCAVFWPSHPKNATSDGNAQELATTETTENGYVSEVETAPQGSLEDMILNDRRTELDDLSALELADASLVDDEEADLSADAPIVAKNPVASTSYEGRLGDEQIVSSSFETQIESKSVDEVEANKTEPKQEAPVVQNEQCQTVQTNANARPNSPGYFARAANLPGKHNSVALRNFARAANLVEPDAAYSPRSLTSATRVDDLEAGAR